MLLACSTTDTATLDAFLQEHGGRPCFDWSAFTCITLDVPRDHLSPGDGPRLGVTFAVLPAARPELRKGVFVVATGGPGSSGVLSADYYTSGYDQSILDSFDIVFFDQRGMGFSGNVACPQAAATYYLQAIAPGGEAAEYLQQVAGAFAEGCVHELTDSELLPFLGTAQAIEDLEQFRQQIGAEKLWLYGESYGTQFAQHYAAKYPDRLAGMILDGTVDMTLTGVEYYRQQAQGFNDTLIAAFEACLQDSLCARDASMLVEPSQAANLPIQTYDALLERLQRSPEKYAFPLPAGGIEERIFTFSDLEFVVASQLYAEGDRMMLMRALLDAADDMDIVPLARLLYHNLSINPQTLTAITDESYSDAVYYAVECQDYGYPGNSPEEKAQNYLAAGAQITLPRFKSILYDDLPCAFWPAATSNYTRPEPVRAEGVPVLVLGATADPVTPVEHGISVFQNLSNGFLITTTGGPHVSFGYGKPCPDDLIAEFLVEGRTPASRSTTCDGRVMDSYVPLAPESAATFANLEQALTSFEVEMAFLPEFYYWSGYESLTVGCAKGGTLQAENADDGIAIQWTNCAFSSGFHLTGSAIYDSGNDTLTASVTTAGNWSCDGLEYQRTAETIQISGSCNGGTIQTQAAWASYAEWSTWKQGHPIFTTGEGADGP
jgi:pimeloyl-ACP methyl ester carboxylesterase